MRALDETTSVLDESQTAHAKLYSNKSHVHQKFEINFPALFKQIRWRHLQIAVLCRRSRRSDGRSSAVDNRRE